MRSRVPLLVGLGCALTLLGLCFGKALFRGGQFAYRDAGHFYYPLYLRVQQEWEARRIPLWSPEENAGMPLLGNPTAAVLYPGKLVFAVVSYPWGMRLYVVGHAVLALVAMFALMRSWGVSRAGSGLAALGYAFGAPVLFQYCNVIFLVGAAWTPLGLRAVDRWLRLGKRTALIELAGVLAMQTLGGDPEAAYVVGLCAAGYALILGGRGGERAEASLTPAPGRRLGRWQWTIGMILGVVAWVAIVLAAGRYYAMGAPEREKALQAALHGAAPQETALDWSPTRGQIVLIAWGVVGLVILLSAWRRWRRRGTVSPLLARLVGLAGAGALGAAVMGAQLVPVLEFSTQSARATEEGPHEIYPFSLEPYRVAELAWPNVFGTVYSGNRAWLDLLPPRWNHKIWVPSIYVGGLTLLLALGAAGWRGGPPWRAWLTGIMVLSLVASLGEFGSPLWSARWSPSLARYLGPHDKPGTPAVREDGYPRDGDGSPYWLMAMGLPGFGSFRYPSKLLTFTTLALAGLAGIGWDHVASGSRRKFAWLAIGLVAASAAALAGVSVERPRIERSLRARGAETMSQFGPFELEGAMRELRVALLHGAAVGLAALVLFRLARTRPRAAGVLALVVTTADLAVANAGMVWTVPQSEFDRTPKALEVIAAAEREHPESGPYRVYRTPVWSPFLWREKPSANRVADFVRWERDTIQPKYGIPYGVQYTMTEGVAELYDYLWFFGSFYRHAGEEVARQLGIKPGEEFVYLPRRGIDLWNTRYFIVPVAPAWRDEHRGIASLLNQVERVYPPREVTGDAERYRQFAKDEDVQIFRNLSEYPRAWVVHEARYIPRPIRGMRRPERKAIMEEILFQDDRLWHDPARVAYDPRQYAWVEAEDRAAVAARLPRSASDPAERVDNFRYGPQKVEFDAHLYRPGLVVLADVYYPGWRLTIDGKPAPIYRVNRMMRGALVDAGDHHLVYVYEPDSFWNGVALSIGGLIATLVVGVWFWRRPLAPWAPV